MDLKLKDLQKEFINYIYSDCDKCSQELLSNIKAHSILESLKTYKRNSILSLFDTIKITYYSVCLILGEEFFKSLVFAYIEKNRSRSGNLDMYGFSFPNFLQQKNISPQYLMDIAILDLNFHLISMMPDFQAIPIEEFKNIPQQEYENITFILNPTCKILSLEHDVVKYWQYMHEHEKTNAKIRITSKESQVLIFRDDNNHIHYSALDVVENYFLNLCQEGKRFFDIFESLIEIDSKFDLNSLLKKFIEKQIIIGFTYNH